MKGQELFYDLCVGGGVTGQQDVTGTIIVLARYTSSEDNAPYHLALCFTTLATGGLTTGKSMGRNHDYNVGLDYGFLKGRYLEQSTCIKNNKDC